MSLMRKNYVAWKAKAFFKKKQSSTFLPTTFFNYPHNIDFDSFDYVNKKQYNNKLNRNPNGTRNK